MKDKLKELLRLLPRVPEQTFYLFVTLWGVLHITEGGFTIWVADNSPHIIPINRNVPLGIFLIFFGQWGMWIGPKLQERINNQLRKVSRWYKRRIK